jgi:prepilin-type N-terminal cleavage/methylation domain-containing protein
MKGFSLIELLIAVTISVGIGTVLFQLIQQNERVFADESVVLEMHQTARSVVSQIADEIRMAGQGVPLYASTFDAAQTESTAIILPSSTSNRIDFRAGLSNVETNVTTPVPVDLTIGALRTLALSDGSLFSSALGTATPSGRFVYVWGEAAGKKWGWVRGELTGISSTTLTIIPRQAGDGGRTADTVRLIKAPTVSLEEAVSFSITNTTVRRATAANLTNQAAPGWAAANEIGRNITSLTFTYYDANNNVLTINSLAARVSVSHIDVQLVATTATQLSNRTRAIHSLSVRVFPRNLELR